MSLELKRYLETGNVNAMMAEYVASLENIKAVAPEVASRIVDELADQRSFLKLIASENYSSAAVQAAMGNLLTDKYCEGFPFHRFYAGCANVDALEQFACETACKLFGAEHAYVQPHSGADANLCAYWAILNTRVQNPELERIGETNVSELSREQWNHIRELTHSQKLLGLDYYSGGHLTHGYRQNISAQMFDAYSYSVNKETKLLDYDEIRAQALEVKPLILLAGYSAYPRLINFKIMSEIAHDCGAVFMVDMSHFAGLVAGGVMTGEYNPVLWADVVTTTTHKTLRGPRGGMILCKQEFADSVDKGCPLVIGGPLPQMIAAKAVALTEAGKPEFKQYAARIVENSRALAQAFIDDGVPVDTGGTDNHLMLIDVTGFGINGRQAESALISCGVTLNRNALPFDANGPWYTSGLRIGTPAVTTLGMGKDEMKEIASIITLVLAHTRPAKITKGPQAGKLSKSRAVTDADVRKQALDRVHALLGKFLLYPDLDLEFLEKEFHIEND
ncbi:MAG: glycine hydroxymethyltransferase [Sphaerochaetaceae bacterium]|nr:glycine hydroxymethyltransferase [Sphaerochaetaceae bacterium]MDD3162943.1 glycine hydroxymethyltransferase [Sphaerochaetaceae bacterium]MDD4007515.1 glycine hydroxymethyltransferase [Sphaerochaetaceae bacterium]MDD4396672.1 glycine hydroxymethyltransferase [Sphaerochaetaceae bacterium]